MVYTASIRGRRRRGLALDPLPTVSSSSAADRFANSADEAEIPILQGKIEFANPTGGGVGDVGFLEVAADERGLALAAAEV
jgi:hypothetical protein